MGKIFGNKPERQRKRKSAKERADALAEKYLFDLLRKDESVMLAYIKKQYDLIIPPAAEREMTRLIEEFKLRIHRAVADKALQDALADGDLRDRILSELLGKPYPPPRARGQGVSMHGPNFQSHFKKIMDSIKLYRDLEQMMGVQKNSLASFLNNPDFAKAIVDVITIVVASRKQAQESTGKTYEVDINGKLVKMNQAEYERYCSLKNFLQLPRPDPPPAQGENQDKPASDKDNTTDNPGAQKMRRSSHYRIYVLGHLPPDIKERIAALHATALLKQRNGDVPVINQGLDSKISKGEHSTTV